MKQFDHLSAAEKRVMIAKDVISKLKTRQFVAEAQCWVQHLEEGAELFSQQDINEARQFKNILQDLLIPDDPKCKACALGGCFVSAVDLFNDITVDSINSVPKNNVWIDDMSEYLAQFFKLDQLKLIEMAFEFGAGWHSPSSESSSEDTEKCAAAMYFHIKDPQARMISIMGNIIENNGEFVVPVNDELISYFHETVQYYDPEVKDIVYPSDDSNEDYDYLDNE